MIVFIGKYITMINKIHFFGCSVTAGNELWEEQNIPNYHKLTFAEARKAAENLPMSEVSAYNRANSFPALTAQEIGCEFENHGIPGISNKEIAGRAIAYFPESHYEGIEVFLQLTTHNRLFLRYKETEEESTVGSFVVMAKADDNRLSKSQNNLLKEMFFEFYNETILSQDDHIYMYYAADVLRSKGINAHILWCSVDVLDWSNWDADKNCDTQEKPVPILNDKNPQYITAISRHISGRHHEFNFFGKPLLDLVGPNSHLPRFHYKQSAHTVVAKAIAEKLKNV
jgi:hypothetical protein